MFSTTARCIGLEKVRESVEKVLNEQYLDNDGGMYMQETVAGVIKTNAVSSLLEVLNILDVVIEKERIKLSCEGIKDKVVQLFH